jgi:hypothetical protein
MYTPDKVLRLEREHVGKSKNYPDEARMGAVKWEHA